MANEVSQIKNKNIQRVSGPLATLVAFGFLAGCSQVPDAVNPVEWYNNSVEFFSDETPEDTKTAETETSADEQTMEQQVVAAEQKGATFPTLSNVELQKQRAQARDAGLVADVEGRKYAPAVARQGDAVNALNSPPPSPPVASAAAPVAPAPEAQPKAPVEMANVASPATPVAPTSAAPVAAAISTGNAQHDDFQARFAQRLAEINAQVSQGVDLPIPNTPNTMSASAYSSETVVVSSTGIETGYGDQASQSMQAMAPLNSELTYVERPARPLSQGAVKVATIRFENGSARLSRRDRQILASVMKLKNERGGRIHIVGHASSRTGNTDPVKHKMINFEVSVARADVIAKELMRMGVDQAQLQIDAISDSAPQYLEVMPSGEAGNRRAEIYLES